MGGGGGGGGGYNDNVKLGKVALKQYKTNSKKSLFYLVKHTQIDITIKNFIPFGIITQKSF